MRRLTIPLLAAMLALPILAPVSAKAVPPPSPRHERAQDFKEIALSPEVFSALGEPMEAIRVVDGERHLFVVETKHCSVSAQVKYHNVPDTVATEIRVEVGEATCRSPK